jgi:hypothetical protein
LLDQPVRSADATAHVMLLHDEQGASVVGTNGAVIASVSPEVIGGARALLYDGDLWIPRSDGQDVVMRRVRDVQPREHRIAAHLPAPLDMMRCSSGVPRRCFISWKLPGHVVHAIVDGDLRGVGPPFELAIEEHALDVAAGGRRVLGFDDHQIVEREIATGVERVLHRERRPTCKIVRAMWTPSATSFVFAVWCEPHRMSLLLQPARRNAVARTLAQFDAVLTGIAVLADDEIVYSTIGYDSRLVLVDRLPPP